jgi:hypothetical protein
LKQSELENFINKNKSEQMEEEKGKRKKIFKKSNQ